MAIALEGFVLKKTKGIFNRYQKKYLQVISNGAYMAYYDQQPERKKATVPNGVFFIHRVYDIQTVTGKDNQFNFKYDDRVFHFQVSKAVEAQIWVLCLQFLHKHSLECIGGQSKRPDKYFTNYNDVVKIRGDDEDDDDKEEDEFGVDRSEPDTKLSDKEKNKLQKTMKK